MRTRVKLPSGRNDHISHPWIWKLGIIVVNLLPGNGGYFSPFRGRVICKSWKKTCLNKNSMHFCRPIHTNPKIFQFRKKKKHSSLWFPIFICESNVQVGDRFTLTSVRADLWKITHTNCSIHQGTKGLGLANSPKQVGDTAIWSQW